MEYRGGQCNGPAEKKRRALTPAPTEVSAVSSNWEPGFKSHLPAS